MPDRVRGKEEGEGPRAGLERGPVPVDRLTLPGGTATRPSTPPGRARARSPLACRAVAGSGRRQ